MLSTVARQLILLVLVVLVITVSGGYASTEQRYIQQRNLTQNPSQRAHGRTRLFQMNQARQREQQTQYGAARRRHYGQTQRRQRAVEKHPAVFVNNVKPKIHTRPPV